MDDLVAGSAPTAHHAFLLQSLAWKRSHVLEAIEGLDDEALNRAHVASGWTPLDLVRHLTVDVERYWFQAVMLAEPDAVAFASGDSSGWQVGVPEAYDDVVAAYRDEITRSDRVLASLAPEAKPRWVEGAVGRADLTSVIVHVLVDTATHAGQLDIVREGIDGRQYLVVHP
ncbi:DinB family protein [Micromonospora pallida]|nr:DinB family protein [Micromonospora pallida]